MIINPNQCNIFFVVISVWNNYRAKVMLIMSYQEILQAPKLKTEANEKGTDPRVHIFIYTE